MEAHIIEEEDESRPVECKELDKAEHLEGMTISKIKHCSNGVNDIYIIAKDKKGNYWVYYS